MSNRWLCLTALIVVSVGLLAATDCEDPISQGGGGGVGCINKPLQPGDGSDQSCQGGDISWSVNKRFQKFRWHGDGTYGTNWTMTGHAAWSTGFVDPFALSVVHIKLGEMCTPPDINWQWDYDRTVNAALFGSPYSSVAQGGYHTREFWEPWTCIQGHALYWEWSTWWSDSSYGVEDTDFDTDCHILEGFGGGGGPIPLPCSS